MIGEAFPNENGGHSRDSAISKGGSGSSIFDTPFETRPVKIRIDFGFPEYPRPTGQLKANTWATAGTGYARVEDLVLRQQRSFLECR